MSNWYIYVHLRSDNKEPFYIGKGKGRRAFIQRCRSVHWNNIVNKHGYLIDFLEIGLTESEANSREIFWIATIGRRDLKEGTLVNYTNGGEGSSGRKMSEYAKAKIIAACTNKPTSKKQKEVVGSFFRGKSGALHNKSKPIKCIQTGKVWGSMSEGERELNLGGGSISWSIKHQRPIYNMTFEKVR